MFTYQKNEPVIRGATFFADTYKDQSLMTALGLDWYGDILPRWATQVVEVGENAVIPPEMAQEWLDELYARTRQARGSLARVIDWPAAFVAHSSEDSLNDRLHDLLSFLWISAQAERAISVML